jgi:hypothetical protein
MTRAPMRSLWRVPGLLAPLRVGTSFLICAAGAVVLVCVGQTQAAAGVAIGFVLYVLNGFLMAETARSLAGNASRRHAAVAAGFSSTGRLLLLGAGLSVVALFLGRETLLGACGALLAAQVNLHVLGLRAKEMD